MIDPKIWNDQYEFNMQLRNPPTEYKEQIELTKEFALHMITEITEMLSACGVWEMHRTRDADDFNPENVRRQLIDQFKYWMSMCQIWGFTVGEMENSYWRKSATVRQRYAEEHIHQLGNTPIAVVDIDNVLCDYTVGFADWLRPRMAKYHPLDPDGFRYRMTLLEKIVENRLYLDAESLQFPRVVWEHIQREFRLSGALREMPIMAGARELIDSLKEAGIAIVALTSRPIDLYPNIYDDTLLWFHAWDMQPHVIWWGTDKAEKLSKMIPNLPNIVIAIDDDPRYIKQYALLGLKGIVWVSSPSDLAVITQRIKEGEFHVDPR